MKIKFLSNYSHSRLPIALILCPDIYTHIHTQTLFLYARFKEISVTLYFYT